MATNVLAFPMAESCPVCKRQVAEGDLSECYECGARFCRHCHECDCDRAVQAIAKRMEELKQLKPGLLARLWKLVA